MFIASLLIYVYMYIGDSETVRGSESSETESESDCKSGTLHKEGAPTISELQPTTNIQSSTHTQLDTNEGAPLIKKSNKPKPPSPKPSRTVRSVEPEREKEGQERERDVLTQSSKSELSSLLQTSQDTISEKGRGFTLSPIHSRSLTASGHLNCDDTRQDLVREGAMSKGRIDSSLSQELVNLEEVTMPVVKTSPTRSGGEGVREGEEEVADRESGGEETAHIPSLESKPLALSGSRDMSVGATREAESKHVSLPSPTHRQPSTSPQTTVTSAPSLGAKATIDSEKDHVSLPSPSHRQTRASSTQVVVTSAPSDKLKVETVSSDKEIRSVPSSKSATTSNIEIHPPTFEPKLNTGRRRVMDRGNGGLLGRLSVGPTQLGEEEGVRDHDEREGERREMDCGNGGLLRQLGVGPAEIREEEGGSGSRGEREGEAMLRVAGDELERELRELQSALQAAGLPEIGAGSRDRETTHKKHHLSSQTPSAATDELEGTIRALATEELTSITKELLYLQEKKERKSSHALQTTSSDKAAGGVRGDRGLVKGSSGFPNNKTGLTATGTGSVTHKTRSADTGIGVSGRKTGLAHRSASTKLGQPIDGLSSSSRASLTSSGGVGRGSRGGRRGEREGGRGEKGELEMLQNEVETLKQALAAEKVVTHTHMYTHTHTRTHTHTHTHTHSQHGRRENASMERGKQLYSQATVRGNRNSNKR